MKINFVGLLVSTLLSFYPGINGLNGGACKAGDWLKVDNQDFFILIRGHGERSNKGAESYCSSMGGHLLILRSQHKQMLVEDAGRASFNCPAPPYRIGLSQKSGEKNLRWTDGKMFSPYEYQDWKYTKGSTDNSEFCVTVNNCHPENGTWERDSCSTHYPFVCETKKPCSSLPTMVIGGGSTADDEQRVDIYYEQDVTISCKLRGLSTPIVKVTITCDNNPGKGVTGKKHATGVFHIGVEMHKERCVCQADTKFSKEDESFFIVSFFTNPRLQNGTQNSIEISVLDGGSVDIKFVMYANPSAYDFNVTRDGQNLNSSRYRLKLDDVFEKPLHKMVTVSLKDIGYDDMGTYNVLVGNGLGKNLNFQAVIVITHRDMATMYLLLGTFIFSFIVVMLLCGRVTYKARKAEEEILERRASRISRSRSKASQAYSTMSAGRVPSRVRFVTRTSSHV